MRKLIIALLITLPATCFAQDVDGINTSKIYRDTVYFDHNGNVGASSTTTTQLTDGGGKLLPIAIQAGDTVAVEITPTGIRLVGNATYYNDLRVAANSVKVPGTGAPGWSEFDGDMVGLYGYFFDSASTECVYFDVQLPHSYAHGTDLSPHVHWVPYASSDAVPADQRVVWRMEYSIAEINDAFGAAVSLTGSTIAPDDTTEPVINEHYLTPLGTIDGSSIDSVSAMLICKLCRLGGDAADTFEHDAAFLELDFHYQIDGFGSEELYIKE